MQNLIEWFTTYWATIAIVLGVLITILNAATQVWHERTGAVRILQFIASIFSVVRSKGADPGVLGALKLPGVPELPPKSGTKSGLIASVLLVLCLGLVASGCATLTPRAGIAKGLQLIGGSDAVALQLFSTKCAEAKAVCVVAKRPPAECPGWLECDANRTKYVAAMEIASAQLAVVNRILISLGVK